jgi:hypothetical protein
MVLQKGFNAAARLHSSLVRVLSMGLSPKVFARLCCLVTCES